MQPLYRMLGAFDQGWLSDSSPKLAKIGGNLRTLRRIDLYDPEFAANLPRPSGS